MSVLRANNLAKRYKSRDVVKDVSMEVRSGEVVGRLRYARGEVLPGTDLAVAARNLEISLLDHRIEGMGTVNLRFKRDSADASARSN